MDIPIICPKCHEPRLWKTNSPKMGEEFYCFFCHEHFGLIELVTQWGYDAGDFFGNNDFIGGRWVGMGEPIWDTKHERAESYQVVNHMLMGIPELDDYQDLKNTQMEAL